jgi:hypothetical protein
VTGILLSMLLGTGSVGPPGSGSATAAPAVQASPHAPAPEALLPRKPPPQRAAPRAPEAHTARSAPEARTAPSATAGRTAPSATAGRAAPPAPEARAVSARVVAPTQAAALFARHSWYVPPPPPPPPPPPAPPPPPPEPTAPPLPYTFVGSYAPAGDRPVFFLARGDRVIDAHVGDRLDGLYQLESATDGQLVLVYLPLNTRQNLAAGASR